MSPITEQALSLESPVANPDEARDLDSQRASSFLDLASRIAESIADDAATCWYIRQMDSPGCDPSAVRERYISYVSAKIQRILDGGEGKSDFLPTSAGSVATSPKPAAGRGFFRT